MKENIHPKYFQTTAHCACGATYQIGSTKENIRIDICSNCHPLFTGTEKLLDTAGRVEKFKKKYEQAAEREKIKKDTSAQKKAEKKRVEKEKEELSVMAKIEELRKGKPKEAKAPPKKEEPARAKEAAPHKKPAAHKVTPKKSAPKKKSK